MLGLVRSSRAPLGKYTNAPSKADIPWAPMERHAKSWTCQEASRLMLLRKIGWVTQDYLAPCALKCGAKSLRKPSKKAILLAITSLSEQASCSVQDFACQYFTQGGWVEAGVAY